MFYVGCNCDSAWYCYSQDEVEGRVTRSGASLKSPEVNGQPKGRGGGKKRGRKRKAEENSYKISDFVDNQVRYSGCGFVLLQ